MLAKTLTTPTRTADVSGDLDHPGVSVDPSLEERLRREILQSERTRMLILAGLSGSLLVVFPALVLVFGENYARIFGTEWAAQVLAVFVLLASYELAIRQIVGRRLEQGKTLPRWMQFWNAFVETSVPSILILLGLRHADRRTRCRAPLPISMLCSSSSRRCNSISGFRCLPDALRRRSMWSCRQWSSEAARWPQARCSRRCRSILRRV